MLFRTLWQSFVVPFAGTSRKSNAHRGRHPEVYGVLVVLASLFCGSAAAQTTGALSGSVTDPSGASVAGATVEARNLETDFSRSVVTTQNGTYRLLALPIGEYEIHVRKDGFAEAIQ